MDVLQRTVVKRYIAKMEKLCYTTGVGDGHAKNMTFESLG